MFKFTFNSLALLVLSLVATVNGADIPDLDSEYSGMMTTALNHYEKKCLINAKNEYLSISENSNFSLPMRLQALDALSKFNRAAAVQGYLRLLSRQNLGRSEKMRIEIQLTLLTPDLSAFTRIVSNPNSTPLAHFNAAYYLQDWLSPEHAVYPFQLLLTKIKMKRDEYYLISQDSNASEYYQHHIETLKKEIALLKKIFKATAVIVQELELKFNKNENNLSILTRR